ncbi:hypothetical protein H6P81_019344 [Aristolochia fimbriata]|uniref:LAGLIDADG homing endonuclease n=1 Tax=Aristolochia fimbriata TaxID=158543 RepID=A0AAV7DT65_ARIFI|nr:hypothetical protein H6P81_019344 [Aristolochia fimbriata]
MPSNFDSTDPVREKRLTCFSLRNFDGFSKSQVSSTYGGKLKKKGRRSRWTWAHDRWGTGLMVGIKVLQDGLSGLINLVKNNEVIVLTLEKAVKLLISCTIPAGGAYWITRWNCILRDRGDSSSSSKAKLLSR